MQLWERFTEVFDLGIRLEFYLIDIALWSWWNYITSIGNSLLQSLVMHLTWLGWKKATQILTSLFGWFACLGNNACKTPDLFGGILLTKQMWICLVYFNVFKDIILCKISKLFGRKALYLWDVVLLHVIFFSCLVLFNNFS